jgi:hypothetical protein
MFDSHLAEMYGVETKVLNQAVKRNVERFPETFCFQLTEVEFSNLRSQFVTSSDLRFQYGISNKEHGGRRYLPYVFTEQGVAMLSGVLRSEFAVQVSIRIMTAFVEMRKLMSTYSGLFQRLSDVEKKQLQADEKFERIFNALENRNKIQENGIFYDGQIFDAYVFVAEIIRQATNSIILIDNYIDETVFTLFTKRKIGVTVTFYTKTITKQLLLDAQKHNEQYEAIEIKEIKQSHDRFMIIDNRDIYHFGASLKDLGKKWFAFSKFDQGAVEMLGKLGNIK